MAIKPMLFNTEMVRSILDGRKTCTRRVVKPHNPQRAKLDDYRQGYGLWFSETTDGTADKWYIKDYSFSPCWISDRNYIKLCAPYHPGDILYVRETFDELPVKPDGSSSGRTTHLYYKADGDKRPNGWQGNWHPSIHMPKEAARIFLRVTDVRVERLQEITITGLIQEGLIPNGYLSQYSVMTESEEWFKKWMALWDSTIKPADRECYGWEASPWVWVIEFKRISREEADNG